MKKTKRSFVSARIVLALGLVANLAAAVLYSPLTRLRGIRVVGAPAYDQDRIDRRLQRLGSTPFLQVNFARVESDLQTLPALARAELSGNLFGRGVLKLVYREPIARLLDSKNTVMDREGVFFRADEVPPNLYEVRVEPGLIAPGATVAGQVSVGGIADLCGRLRDLPAFDGALITFDRTQGLCIAKESRRIVLGPPDGMDEKLETLGKALEDPRWEDVLELNLMAPSSPVYRSRNSNPS